MRGAIVGFGVIASTGHTPAFLTMPEHEIVAVADFALARRQAAREQIPGVRTYANYQDLLAGESELDFLDIATPPAFHLEISKAAAARGLNVLCEKPITISLEQARELLLAAKRHQVTIFPCHNYKHAPVVKEMRGAIESGAIGKVRSATLNTFRTTNAKGTPEDEYAGGGIVMDHGSHSCYLTFMFFGGKPPLSVAARTFSLLGDFDTEDNVCCTLNFEEGFAMMHLSWTAGVRKVLYALQGSKGAVVVDEDNAQFIHGAEVERRTIVSKFDDASHTEWFTSMFRQFEQDIEQGNHVTTELIEAYWCMATIEAIYASQAQQSREVPIETSLDFLDA